MLRFSQETPSYPFGNIAFTEDEIVRIIGVDPYEYVLKQDERGLYYFYGHKDENLLLRAEGDNSYVVVVATGITPEQYKDFERLAKEKDVDYKLSPEDEREFKRLEGKGGREKLAFAMPSMSEGTLFRLDYPHEVSAGMGLTDIIPPGTPLISTGTLSPGGQELIVMIDREALGEEGVAQLVALNEGRQDFLGIRIAIPTEHLSPRAE